EDDVAEGQPEPESGPGGGRPGPALPAGDPAAVRGAGREGEPGHAQRRQPPPADRREGRVERQPGAERAQVRQPGPAGPGAPGTPEVCHGWPFRSWWSVRVMARA